MVRLTGATLWAGITKLFDFLHSEGSVGFVAGAPALVPAELEQFVAASPTTLSARLRAILCEPGRQAA